MYDGHCRDLSQEEVKQKIEAGEEFVIRQKIPKGIEVSFDDLVYGKVNVNTNELDDSILIKSNGLPTYNFANVVDDHLMKISHVIRGSEYLSSTNKYTLLYKAFNWEDPIYIHLPPIMKSYNKKFSKREGDASFIDLLNRGYLKDAIINYLALLGWNPGDNREIFNLNELIKYFSIKGLHKAPAIFDINKLNWFNKEYIKRMDPEFFHKMAVPYYKKMFVKNRKVDFEKVSKILQNRIEVLSEIPSVIDFFEDLPVYDI